MKSIRKTGFLLTIFLLIHVSCDKEELDLSYQESEYFKVKLGCMNMPRPADSYNYPVYPTMDKWADFNTAEEMMNACEIPKKRLQSMSTQAVIQALWEYPFFIEIVHRKNHLQMDFETTMGNGMYRELEKRKDASIRLLERYRVMPSVCEGILYPKVFEVLISQPVFLARLSTEEKREVIQQAFEKDSILEKYPEHANSYTREISWFLIGRVMQSDGYRPFIEEIDKDARLKRFLDTSALVGFYDYEEAILMFERIINHGKEFKH